MYRPGDARNDDAAGSGVTPRIGVVGGEGQMGLWLRRFWERRGLAVSFSDRGSLLTNEDVAQQSDLTFVAVPLTATPDVLVALSPYIGADQALISIASLMGPSATALVGCVGQTLCAHPVFGPSVREVHGLPVVVAPIRGERWASWLIDSLRDAGLAVRESTPPEHDKAMAVVQALLHSLYVALCETMGDAAMEPGRALEWASPTMRLQLGMIARILGQDPQLYAGLVVGNPWAPDLLDSLAASLTKLASHARSGDIAGFAAAFTRANQSFGDLVPDLAGRAEAAIERFS
jgi:prephenate dehydrogenase